MNGNDRASQAERAAHWLTETLEDLNRQAGSYGEMVRSLDGAKTSLLTLVGTTSQTITTLEQHISTLESLKSGEFVERVNTLAENLSGAQGIFDNALNRIVSFTGEYTNTHRALQETSQSFVEEGKKLYTEVKTLVDSLSQESEKALAKLGEKWSGDIETLDNSFRSANYNFSTLFHSFEEKLATIQSLLDQLTPMARTVADDLTANLERTMSDLNGRLTTDQENLLAIHNEDNRTLLSTFTDGIRTTGEALSVQMAETIQKTREEWEALFATRTEEIKNIFSILQNTLEGMEKNLREENEKNIQGNENLRSDLTRAVETIGQAHQTITSSLETLPSQLQGITQQTMVDFQDHLNTVIHDTGKDWLTEIVTTKDKQVQELITTKSDILNAITTTRKGIFSTRGILIVTLIFSVAAIVLRFVK